MRAAGVRGRCWRVRSRSLRIGLLLVGCILPPQVSMVAAGSTPTPANSSLASGSQHTCALTRFGRVKCWGRNSLGQLGNGTTIQSSVPVDVTGLTNGVRAIAAGRDHTCALTSDGGVKCWGGNSNLQLANGTQEISLVPVDVLDLSSGVSAISAGGDLTCVLTSVGGVKCWGSFRAIGGGGGTGLPMDVSNLTEGVLAIASGSEHACALTSSEVFCFNFNSLAYYSEDAHWRSPIAVAGLSTGVSAVAAGGRHTCALTTAGEVWCWGANGSGQVGNGATSTSAGTVRVVGVESGAGAVSAGGLHTCALTSGGGVRCWGENASGQLGNGSTASSAVPVSVVGLASGVAAISAGPNHTCVRTTANEIKCWGSNSNGQLGDGTTAWSTTAVDVAFIYEDAPPTDMVDADAGEEPDGLPLLPLLAGLAGGIAMLVRRLPRAPA